MSPASLWLSAQKHTHARPQGRRTDAKENTAAFRSGGDRDQNLENLRWQEALVAQASKEGIAMHKESPENLPKSPTPPLLTTEMQVWTLRFHVWSRVTGKL